MRLENGTVEDSEQTGKKRISIVRILLLLIPMLLVYGAILDHFVWRHGHYCPHCVCIANLKNIEGAKASWTLEYKKLPADVPTEADLFGKGRYIPVKLCCPKGGTYTLGTVSEQARCSIATHVLP